MNGVTRVSLVAACVVIASLSLVVAQGRTAEALVVARDAWVRQPLRSKDETALYLVLENHSSMRRAVVAVSSPAASKGEMHEMTMEKAMMRMTPVQEIGIPPNGKTTLGANGLHIMLYGLKSRPAVGDMITATLTLDDGTMVPVTAIVRK